MSEQAAAKIGANAFLVSVAALYHDIGKLSNPAFFSEESARQRKPARPAQRSAAQRADHHSPCGRGRTDGAGTPPAAAHPRLHPRASRHVAGQGILSAGRDRRWRRR
ncbi:MAG: HDIG domain-containing protein [Chloroflexi bacterium]|nr:HDIG domain-containing protein [Chloroflexota bacterium]